MAGNLNGSALSTKLPDRIVPKLVRFVASSTSLSSESLDLGMSYVVSFGQEHVLHGVDLLSVSSVA